MEEHESRSPSWRALMDRAAGHFEAERFADALSNYDAALRLAEWLVATRPLCPGLLLARIVPQFTRGRALTRLGRLVEAERAYVDAVRFARSVATDTRVLPPLREEAQRHLRMLEQELATHRERHGQRVPDAPTNAPHGCPAAGIADGPRVVH
jgi:hypothetical protein